MLCRTERKANLTATCWHRKLWMSLLCPKKYRTGVFAGSTSPTTAVKQSDGTWGETETKGSLRKQYLYNASKVKPGDFLTKPFSHLKQTVGLLGKRASETGYELKVQQDGGSVDAARADLYREPEYLVISSNTRRSLIDTLRQEFS